MATAAARLGEVAGAKRLATQVEEGAVRAESPAAT